MGIVKWIISRLVFAYRSARKQSDESEQIDIEQVCIPIEQSLDVLKCDFQNRLTNELTRSERLIIVLYYYEEMTMKEIGLTLDLSENRVSQMHADIIRRLRNPPRKPA